MRNDKESSIEEGVVTKNDRGNYRGRGCYKK